MSGCMLGEVRHEMWPATKNETKKHGLELTRKSGFFSNTVLSLSSNIHIMYSKDISSVLLGF